MSAGQASQRLSIGLPVFNGARHLATAIESLLAQTYRDFELIIVDNASTDSTSDICAAYARRDARVRYHRNSANIGAAANWYLTLDLSSGHYFKWAADDDEYNPQFLQRCIDVLDRDPNVVLCYARAQTIDDAGARGGRVEFRSDTASPSPSERLASCLSADHLCIQLYGVIRTEVLRGTTRYSGYIGEDRNVLAEICLRGRVAEISEYLFLHRLSPNAWGALVTAPNVSTEELLAYDPSIDWGRERSTLKRVVNYFGAVSKVPMSPIERLKCYGFLMRFVGSKAADRLRQTPISQALIRASRRDSGAQSS